MRLIDADELDRIMYHKAFEVDDGRNVWNSGLWIRYKIYEEANREAKTIDAVPVIRCKDCKYRDDLQFPPVTIHLCARFNKFAIYTIDDLERFCSWGERKEEK